MAGLPARACLPTAQLDDHGVVGNVLGDRGGGGGEDVDFVVGQVVLVQVGDLRRGQKARKKELKKNK